MMVLAHVKMVSMEQNAKMNVIKIVKTVIKSMGLVINVKQDIILKIKIV